MGSKRATGSKQESVTALKLLQKLEVARASRQKVERKVGKLRVRLEQAEARLAKREKRVNVLQAKAEPAATSAVTEQGNDTGGAVSDTLDGTGANTEMPVSTAARHNGSVPPQRKRSHGGKKH